MKGENLGLQYKYLASDLDHRKQNNLLKITHKVVYNHKNCKPYDRNKITCKVKSAIISLLLTKEILHNTNLFVLQPH